MLDHPARRQAGQFVIISGAEQLVLERLLLADVGRARDQELAVADQGRPMGRKPHLAGGALADGLLGNERAVVAQEFETGLAAAAQSAGCISWAQLRCGGVVIKMNRPCSSRTVTPAGRAASTSFRSPSSDSRVRGTSASGAAVGCELTTRLCMGA